MYWKGSWKERSRVHNNNIREKKGVIVKLWSQFLQKVLAFSARALVLFPTASFLSPYSIFNLVHVAVPIARAQTQTAVIPDTVRGRSTFRKTQYFHVSYHLPTTHSMTSDHFRWLMCCNETQKVILATPDEHYKYKNDNTAHKFLFMHIFLFTCTFVKSKLFKKVLIFEINKMETCRKFLFSKFISVNVT